MALRRPKSDEMAPPSGGASTASPNRPPSAARSAEQCMATGQALVQAGQLDAERARRALQDADGDLLVDEQPVADEVRRRPARLAQAVAAACQVPGRRQQRRRARPGDRQPDRREGRPRAQGHPGRRGERHARALRRRPVAGAPPAGRVGHRTALLWKASDTRRSPRSSSRCTARRPTSTRSSRTFAAEDEQTQAAETIAAVSLDDQAPVVQLVPRIVEPGAARPRVGHPHRAARRPPAHPVPRRRSPDRGVQPPDVGAQRADQPPEDHVGDEHRREAGAAGRPVLDQGRRSRDRRPRRVGGDRLRREDRHAYPRQVEVDGRPRRARHAARDVQAATPSSSTPRSAW